MICAVDELGIGEDHAGILVLPPDTPLGVDFVELRGAARRRARDHRDPRTAATPCRIRGVARELASAYQVPFTDPALTFVPVGRVGSRHGEAGTARQSAAPWPAEIADPTACDRFVLREVRGFDPKARTPLWMQVRLARSGCAASRSPST